MTCIVAVADGKKVVMGGDSASSDDTIFYVVTNPKVFKVGEFLFGACGSFRLIDLLHYSFADALKKQKVPRRMDKERWMRTVFVDILREVIGKGGLKEVEHGKESSDGSFIVGFRGSVYVVQEDFSILSFASYIAAGAGESAALGALHALRDSGKTPKEKVRRALEASESNCPQVRRPFIYEEIENLPTPKDSTK